jgi:hypothetical protein
MIVFILTYAILVLLGVSLVGGARMPQTYTVQNPAYINSLLIGRGIFQVLDQQTHPIVEEGH